MERIRPAARVFLHEMLLQEFALTPAIKKALAGLARRKAAGSSVNCPEAVF